MSEGTNPTPEQQAGGPCENTDRHLWPQVSEPGAPHESLHITKDGALGINCGGYVYTKPIREWHKLAGGPFPAKPDAPLTSNVVTCRFCDLPVPQHQRRPVATGGYGHELEGQCLSALIIQRNQLRAALRGIVDFYDTPGDGTLDLESARSLLTGDSPSVHETPTELPESLRDPIQVRERGRELLAKWPCWCPYCQQPHGVNQTPITDAALARYTQETGVPRSTEGLVFDGADDIRRNVAPVLGTDKAVSDERLKTLIRMETESDYHRAFVELWERRGSPVEKTELHLQPRYVLEQIMNNSTDAWAKGVARTCLMRSLEKASEQRPLHRACLDTARQEAEKEFGPPIMPCPGDGCPGCPACRAPTESPSENGSVKP